MSGGMPCRACGVVLPGRVGRCPSCGASLGLGRAPAWVGLAVVAALALSIIGLTRRPRVDPTLAADVQAFTGIRRLSADQKRTEVSGFIDNKGRVPVDVTVRIRSRDVVGQVFADFESGPYRNLAPGSSTPIQAILDMTPVESVEIDVVELAPSRP